MYNFEELNGMIKYELKGIAENMGIEKVSAMKKLDIINAILEKERIHKKVRGLKT